MARGDVVALRSAKGLWRRGEGERGRLRDHIFFPLFLFLSPLSFDISLPSQFLFTVAPTFWFLTLSLRPCIRLAVFCVLLRARVCVYVCGRRSPQSPKHVVVKRVVALENDMVETLGYKQRLVVVPRGHVWVEGDNHLQSRDSNLYGPVPMGLLTGKMTYIIWPPHRVGRVRAALPADAEARLVSRSS